ncbi:MAG: ParA family protein [Mesorhizobium sp.]|jgi:chromosome partitioning protein|uniref:ParA family protein n=1 Tax=Mesorhizobium hunchu TaxID=3157708 RepID=UPI001ACEDD27|nr:ParA family protein [Mesorhizobium sp.]MBN9245715.1 ParA family protein [Mesorhizobium sp.]
MTITPKQPAVSLALSTFKGGAGKTALSINLGAEFGSQGSKTLIIDCDLQQSSYRWYMTSKARKLITDADNLEVIPVSPEQNLQERLALAPPADIHIYDVSGYAHDRAVEVFKRVHAVVIPVILEPTSATQAINISRLLNEIAASRGAPVTPHAAIWNHVDHIALRSNRAIPEVTRILSSSNVPLFETIIRKTNHFSDVVAGFGTLYTKLRAIDANTNMTPSARRRARESVLDAIDQIKGLNNEFISLIGA